MKKWAQTTDGQWFLLPSARAWNGRDGTLLYRSPKLWAVYRSGRYEAVCESDALAWLRTNGYDERDTARKTGVVPAAVAPQPDRPESQADEYARRADNPFLSYGRAGTKSLARHYRPRRLEHIIGQPEAVATLQSYAANPYPAAFLFEGETGVGKTAAAYCLAEELGCNLDEWELGGMHEIPSGEQDVDSVRQMLNLLRLRPLWGSGWKVLVVNEADRMSRPAEMVWLDGLEHLPARSVVIFTTNDAERLSQRFQNRCERVRFTEPTKNDVRELVELIWEAETGEANCPLPANFAEPELGEWTRSFRLALQKLAPQLRSHHANHATQTDQCCNPVGVGAEA